MGWRMPEGWPTEETPEEELETPTEGQEPEEVEEVEEVEEGQGLAEPQEVTEKEDEGLLDENGMPTAAQPVKTQIQEPQEPIVVLKVYGQEIPIYDKDTLIRYAQRGVDYESKMHKLRQWKDQITLVESNPALKALIEKGIAGDDVERYISFARTAPQAVEQEIQEDPEDPMTQLRTIVREEITKTVKPALDEVAHIKQKSAKEEFFDSLRKEDPQYFDIVTKLCQAAYNLPDGHPDALPKSLKQAINTDPQAYKTYYGIMRERVINYLKAQNLNPDGTPSTSVPSTPVQQPSMEQQVRLVKQVKKPPILEDGKGSGQVVARKVMDEAEEIWKMPSTAFKKLVSDAEKRYRR